MLGIAARLYGFMKSKNPQTDDVYVRLSSQSLYHQSCFQRKHGNLRGTAEPEGKPAAVAGMDIAKSFTISFTVHIIDSTHILE